MREASHRYRRTTSDSLREVNEAVELAKSFGGIDGHKYVNGVLDKLAAQIRTVETGAARGN